jgi:hypothetical protein
MSTNVALNDEMLVSELEIERLLRQWASYKGIDTTPAGFYNGIRINRES